MTLVATQNRLKIYADNDTVMNPRDFDNLGTIAYKNRRYILGEEEIDDPIDWLEEMLDLEQSYEYSNERLEYLEDKFFSKYIALPIYLYDHSGITISTSPFGCRWDSGKVGYIYVSKADVLNNFGGKRVTKKLREKALAVLEAEVEEFDMYIRGEVYGFEILDENDEIIDGCGGFFGNDFKENGIKEYIDINLLRISEEELDNLLDNIEIEY